jgi:hypothetical protein
LRGLPRPERESLAPEISRVSRRLHRRRYRHTISVSLGVLLEAWTGIIGGLLIALGLADRANSPAILGTLMWVCSFEPLIKVSVGTTLGIEYDYVYLWGWIEPRFKTAYGSYLAQPPIKRALFHFSGMIGSPLGVGLAAYLTRRELPAANIIAWVCFWITLVPNLAALVAASFGLRRIGRLWLPEGSPTAGVIELRYALGKTKP